MGTVVYVEESLMCFLLAEVFFSFVFNSYRATSRRMRFDAFGVNDSYDGVEIAYVFELFIYRKSLLAKVDALEFGSRACRKLELFLNFDMSAESFTLTGCCWPSIPFWMLFLALSVS